jgi:hypothetical protein
MTIITAKNAKNRANQIGRCSSAGNFPSGNDCTIMLTIRVLPKKSAIIITSSRRSFSQIILQELYHPYYNDYTESTMLVVNTCG